MSGFATVYSGIAAWHLEYHDNKSAKFYRVYVHEGNEIRQWGRVGARGQFQLNKLGSATVARQSAATQIAAKEAKGYQRVTNVGTLSFTTSATYGDLSWLTELSATFDKVRNLGNVAGGSPEPAPAPPKPAKLTHMLCERGDPDAIAKMSATGMWTWDVKWDGVRCIAKVEDGEVTLTSRSNRDITARFPEVVEALTLLPAGTWALDGELIVFDADGKPSFTRVNRRMSLSTSGCAGAAAREPATLVVFDLLVTPGGDVRDQNTFDRLSLMDVLMQGVFDGSERVVRSPRTDDGVALFEQTRTMGLEGVVAKGLDSPYIGGNRGNWVKFRHEVSVSCVVTGVEEGKGNAAGSMGALLLGMTEPDGSVVEVGKVGTGFGIAERSTLFLMKDQILGSVVEVQCAPPKAGEGLRFPVFKGLRTELTPADCSTTQLTAP